jgi:hypothetical protein
MTRSRGKWRLRLVTAGVLAALLIGVTPAGAQQPRPTRLILSPATVDLADRTDTVSVLVDGAPGLSSFEIALSWDADLFVLTAVTPLEELVLQDEDSSDGTGVLRFDYDRSAGRLIIAAKMPGSEEGLESVEEGGEGDGLGAPPEAPPVATTIGLDEGTEEYALVALDFAALAEGESPLTLEPDASTLFDAEGVAIDVAEFREGLLRASQPLDPSFVEQASSAADAVAELGGGVSSGGGFAVVGEAARRVGSTLRDAFAGDAEQRNPRIWWLGALIGGALLAWAGWAIGRDPGDEDGPTDAATGPG